VNAMASRHIRRLVAGGATVVGTCALAAALVIPADAAAPADTTLPSTNGHCAATPNILKSTPKTIQLAHGMTMRIWDNGVFQRPHRSASKR